MSSEMCTIARIAMTLVSQGLISSKAVSESRKLLVVLPTLTSVGVVEGARHQECQEPARHRALPPAMGMAARMHTTTGIHIPSVACLQHEGLVEEEEHHGVETIIMRLHPKPAEGRPPLLSG
jgi:hypothetical protein